MTAGRAVPEDRLARVIGQYEAIGGVSPLNGLTRDLAEGVRAVLASRGVEAAVSVGFRHSTPTLRDGLAALLEAGCDRVVAVATSAYSSRPGCGQYRDELDVAWEALGGKRSGLAKAEPFYAEDGFWRPLADAAREARAELGAEPVLLCTAHSLPVEMAQASRYEAQLTQTAARIATEAGFARWVLAYQSRSGRPDQPWLGPDVSDAIRALAAEGEQRVVLAPIGFVNDHVEVLYDLDHVAVPLARELGMSIVRIPTPGTDVRFVTLLADVFQRIENEFVNRDDVCGAGCCASQ